MWKMEEYDSPNPDSKLSNCYVFKSRLQEYAQKVGYTTPVYETLKEGPSHQPSFRSTVIVNGNRYDSLNGFLNRKAAEQSAAEIALTELAKSGELKQSISMPVHETGLCKNLLQEFAQKMNYGIPTYDCRGVTGNYSCTVEIGETRYIGAVARSKKEAEIKAARTALLALQSCSTRLDVKTNDESLYTVIPVKRKEPEKPIAKGTDTPKRKKKARFNKKQLRTRRNENRGNKFPVQNVAALDGTGTPLVAEQQSTVGALNNRKDPLIAEPQCTVGAFGSSGTRLVSEQQSTVGALHSSGIPLVAEHQSTIPHSQASDDVQVGNAGDSGNNASHEFPSWQLENWVYDAILAGQAQVESSGLLDNKVLNQVGSSQTEIIVSDVPLDQPQAVMTNIITAAYHVNSIEKESVALDSSGTPLLEEQQSTIPYSQLCLEVPVDNTGDSGNNACHEVLSGQLENRVSDVVLADQIQVESTGLLDNNVLCQFGSIESERRASDVHLPDQAQAETTCVTEDSAAYHVESIQKESAASLRDENAGDPCSSLGEPFSSEQRSFVSEGGLVHEVQIENNSGTPLVAEQQSTVGALESSVYPLVEEHRSTVPHSQALDEDQAGNAADSANNAGHEVPSGQLENWVSDAIRTGQAQVESTGLLDNKVLNQFGSSQFESSISDVHLFYQTQAETTNIIDGTAANHADSIQKESVALDSSGTPILVEQQNTAPHSQLPHEIQVENTGDSGNNVVHEVLSGQLENWVSDVVLADHIQVENTSLLDNKVLCRCGSSQLESGISDVQLPGHVQAETICVTDDTTAYHVDSIQKESAVSLQVGNAGAPDSGSVDAFSLEQQSIVSEAGLVHELQVENPGVMGSNAGDGVPVKLENRVVDQTHVESTAHLDSEVGRQFVFAEGESSVSSFQFPYQT
ncbi:Double-stranded RNA-binding protein 1-like protein [Drosera capensis]